MPNMKMALDFSDVQDFEAIDEGVYAMVIEGAKYTPPKPGKEFGQLQVDFTITDGPLANQKRSDWMSFSPKAKFIMARFFERLELVDPETKAGPGLEFDEETSIMLEPDIIGIPVSVLVTQRPYNNKMTNDFEVLERLDSEGEAEAAPTPARAPASRPAFRQPATTGKAPRRVMK